MLARPVTPDPSYDYADACEVTPSPALADRTAEDWLRVMLEGAPSPVRLSLRTGWTVLTLRRPGGVLGWPLVVDGPDRALLRTTSRLGIVPELVLTRDGGVVRFESLLGLTTPSARRVWRAIEGPHRLVVRRLLAQAAQTSAAA